MPVEVELVRIALQAYGKGDIELALELCDPLVRWDERSARPDGELVWGRDDVARAMRIYQEDDWDSYSHETQKLKAFAPGRVVGIYREWGTSYDGLPMDRRLGGLWVVESRLIVSWNAYLTPKEAIRAAKMLSDTGRFRDAPEQGAEGGEDTASTAGAEEPTPADPGRAAKRRAALKRRHTENGAGPRAEGQRDRVKQSAPDEEAANGR